MKTRGKKSTSAVNTSKNKRKPLSDKTNNANTSNTMKRKQVQKNSAKNNAKNSAKNSAKSRQNTSKNAVALNLNLTTNNRGKLTNNLEINGTKTTRKSDVEKNLQNKQKTQNDSLNKTLQQQKNTEKLEKLHTKNELNVKRRSSRLSNEVKIKITTKSNKDKSTINTSKTSDASKLGTNLPEMNKSINKKNIKTPPLKTKRLFDCLKSPSPENSDPYEFKFDPKKEPKPKPKKRGRPKKLDIPSDSSDEEDNSMKPIIKNIRKKVEIKQKIRVTPVERKLRNRLVKKENQAGLAAKINKNKTNNKTCDKIPQNQDDIIEVNSSANNTSIVNEINETNKICDKIPQHPNDIEINPIAKNTSIADEINEIANTFLEDDDFNNDSNVSISTPSRIDIISQLIARKTNTNPKSSTNVFNSTMIHESPYQMAPRSPWRVEVSTIPRKSLNFSVKNTSFTPSYTPDIITDKKKQTTLLGFVNRTPKTDVQITLFQNSPTRKPFENLSNSMSPIRPNRSSSNISAVKRSDDSLFGFTILSDSEDKENSPVYGKIAKKQHLKRPEIKQTPQTHEVQINETAAAIDDDISIPLFEDLQEERKEKRYSRQYTRPQIKRKRNVSFNICSDDDSEDETDIIPVKKKQKDVLTKEEAEEAERLASHYNSYFEEIENYPLCIE